ncbi:xanthosine triphosphate pyrophosphatase [Secundilactobacillus odoratitofui DSM 19909 = JCM 15043]|uniref:Xanthosine triphosphate pyrophosphatase n=1 Tax=Secundilactobacillus odoratitofui DSM 19909 = JCM 15043 TaxID=1423776 RepID=A0A0R1LSX6_9LACO|nr:non-canonical purine NTP pyrophosphatase [Secundilactobacillus odoratitofui]KRK98917.1 xanthosine triphosphate pyrophosphatase [Secundilactobacillus odoratitofui DSM 19909 = JCM 15043]
MTDWLIASNNAFKTADLIKCLAFYGIQAQPYTNVLSPVTFPSETTTSYETNALTKAQFLAKITSCGVIADDSGIEIPALGTHLGVTTKRELHQDVAHSDNQTILLAMAGQADRRATMVSTLAAVQPNQPAIVVTGRVTGQIAQTSRGDYSTGFDKLFQLDHQQSTLAQLPDEQRLPLTHRGRAAHQLAQQLKGE